MTTQTLIEALRADVRAKMAVIHTTYELQRAVALVTEAINLMRTAPEDRFDGHVMEDPDHRLAADLTFVETARADLAKRLDDHTRALESSLFGLVVAQVRTS